jgi:hypothetical protein
MKFDVERPKTVMLCVVVQTCIIANEQWLSEYR